MHPWVGAYHQNYGELCKVGQFPILGISVQRSGQRLPASSTIPDQVGAAQPAEEWYAVYTRARHEKRVEHELGRRSFETFLPQRRIKRRWSDRVKFIDEPLFASYVFVRATRDVLWRVTDTQGAVALLGPSSLAPATIPNAEIDALRRFVEEQLPLDPFPYLREGARAKILSGPLRGIEGFIVRKHKWCRLILSVDLMMRSVAVEIDEALLAPL